MLGVYPAFIRGDFSHISVDRAHYLKGFNGQVGLLHLTSRIGS